MRTFTNLAIVAIATLFFGLVVAPAVTSMLNSTATVTNALDVSQRLGSE